MNYNYREDNSEVLFLFFVYELNLFFYNVFIVRKGRFFLYAVFNFGFDVGSDELSAVVFHGQGMLPLKTRFVFTIAKPVGITQMVADNRNSRVLISGCFFQIIR